MWHEAPELVLKNIFSYLEASDLHAVFLTCRLWHRIATEDVIWKQLVQRLWKIKGMHATDMSVCLLIKSPQSIFILK